MPSNFTEQLNNRNVGLTIALCFIAGGWAAIEWGHTFLGGLCFVIAVIWPTLSGLLTRYQNECMAREQVREANEFAQLRVRARSEAANFPKQQTDGTPRTTSSQ